MVGGICALIAIYNGLGLWVLVVQSLSGYIVSAACMHFLSDQKISFTFNRASFNFLLEVLPFSKNIFGFNIVKYLSQNLDIFYIGYILGAKSAGLFAYFDKLIIIPFTMLSGAIGNYIFAKYANMNHEGEQLFNDFKGIERKHNFIIIPLIIIYCTAITALLKLDLMPKWKEAGEFIPLMGALVIIQVVVSPMGNVLKALGRSNYLFYWSIALMFGMFSGFIILYYTGNNSIEAVLYTLIIINVLCCLLMYRFVKDAFAKFSGSEDKGILQAQ